MNTKVFENEFLEVEATNLKFYYTSFTGCPVGSAVASQSFHTLDIISDNEDNARLKVYDKYEHLMKFKAEDSKAKVFICKEFPQLYFIIHHNGGSLFTNQTGCQSPLDLQKHFKWSDESKDKIYNTLVLLIKNNKNFGRY